MAGALGVGLLGPLLGETGPAGVVLLIPPADFVGLLCSWLAVSGCADCGRCCSPGSGLMSGPLRAFGGDVLLDWLMVPAWAVCGRARGR